MRLAPSISIAFTLLAGCAADDATPVAPATLTHEAYVWQRSWTGPVADAVAHAPAPLSGLRVLTVELDRTGAAAWPAVDVAALAHAGRPVTAVVRLDGSRPLPDLALAPVLDRIAAWQRAGVAVAGVEIDHDCATAALPAYAAWLERRRPPAPLRWSITALPTWAGAPALPRVAAAVDELVVQVHAVRAPRLFDPDQARAWLDRFAAAIAPAAAPLRVALPTYQVELDGARLAADPVEVAALVRSLERRPIAAVRGVVWFRLPVATDRAAWPAPTLAAVIAGAPLAPAIEVRLVARGSDLHDVVIENRGALAGRWPELRVDGALAAADRLGGYTADASDPRRWSPPPRDLPAGDLAVVGWVRGQELTVHANPR
ncbi:MAG TPA: DUF3142 domain-containing protein [Kofleriaceae bacterium]|nr:DUF3142 domain-containing protein [Kofleriaceae bacterium]